MCGLPLAIELDQTGIDGGEAEPGQESGMAQSRQPLAAGIEEHRAQAGQVENSPARDTEQRYPGRRADHSPGPAVAKVG